MYSYIKGRLIEKSPTDLIIECNGIGYHIHISLHTFSLLPQEESLLIYTHFIVKEDTQLLYGFVEKSEREIFKLLLSVSGIGANTARNILSYTSPKELTRAIAINDIKTIQSIKGIGLKTAQRLVLDLQEKVQKLGLSESVEIISVSNENAQEALAALEVLGFVRKSAEKAVNKIVAEQTEISVEAIIKQALKML